MKTRANKIQMDSIRAMWEITKMASAVVLAERQLMQQEPPVEVSYDENTGEFLFESKSVNTLLEDDIKRLEAERAGVIIQANKYIEEEKYELLDGLKEILEIIEDQLKDLKS